MHLKLAVFCLLSLVTATYSAPSDKPTAFDLAGNWESTIEFGKFKMHLVVKVEKSPEGKLSGKIDIPDQGAKDIPVSAMLCNFPAVRWEMTRSTTPHLTARSALTARRSLGSLKKPGRPPHRGDLQEDGCNGSKRNRESLHLLSGRNARHSRLLARHGGSGERLDPTASG